jgi:hypothetical protein
MCIGDFKLTPDLHLFELGGIDVVLGIAWLQILGDTIVNWRKTMSFWLDKKWVTLQGIGSGKESLVDLQIILARPKKEETGSIWGVSKEEQKKESPWLSQKQREEMEQLLCRFDQVFQEPHGLPPRRVREHAINLVEGQNSVNVRPYHYPHHHKNDIEKQVKEMLTAGIIRHNTSSFSSLVILVKKTNHGECV